MFGKSLPHLRATSITDWQSFWPLISKFSGHLDGQDRSLQPLRNNAERVVADGAIQAAAQAETTLNLQP